MGSLRPLPRRCKAARSVLLLLLLLKALLLRAQLLHVWHALLRLERLQLRLLLQGWLLAVRTRWKPLGRVWCKGGGHTLLRLRLRPPSPGTIHCSPARHLWSLSRRWGEHEGHQHAALHLLPGKRRRRKLASVRGLLLLQLLRLLQQLRLLVRRVHRHELRPEPAHVPHAQGCLAHLQEARHLCSLMKCACPPLSFPTSERAVMANGTWQMGNVGKLNSWRCGALVTRHQHRRHRPPHCHQHAPLMSCLTRTGGGAWTSRGARSQDQGCGSCQSLQPSCWLARRGGRSCPEGRSRDCCWKTPAPRGALAWPGLLQPLSS